MSREQSIQRALSELREQIALEDDPANLRKLVMEINLMLDVVEQQLQRIQDGGPSESRH